MKIAIISTISQYEWAGTEEVWAQFAKVALAQGHAVHACIHWRVSHSTRIKALQEVGLEVSTRRPFRPTRLYLLKERVYGDMRSLEAFSPDLLLINSGSLFDILNIPALRQFCARIQVPKLFFCHFVAEGFVPYNREQVRELSRQMQGWIFVSEHNRQLAERQLAYQFNNAHVIVNGSRLKLEEPLSWPEGSLTQFACVARLDTQWKGQDVLLEVLSMPLWRDRNWHLNLYGVGPDTNYIHQLIKHYRLTEKVTCHGYIDDIKSVWQQNHLMVLASRGEGTPLAVLEAMMCGRPTVTTDVGGNREILVSGETGWIAEVATPNALGPILQEAWEERHRWPAIGQSAHRAACLQAQRNPEKQLLSYIEKTVNATVS